jgi:hypothetical protein
MSGKGGVRADEELEGKKKREVMSLLQKMEVLDKVDRGMSIAVIRHHYGGNESTLCLIKKREDVIGE